MKIAMDHCMFCPHHCTSDGKQVLTLVWNDSNMFCVLRKSVLFRELFLILISFILLSFSLRGQVGVILNEFVEAL